MRRVRLLLLIALLLGGSSALCVAQDPESPSGSAEPDARAAYFLLPIEIDTDSGAANGDAIISRVIPANSIPLGETWRLTNVALVVIADAPGGRPGSPGNPESAPGERAFGLGDLTDAIFFAKKGAKLGIGAIFGFPTATNEALGSGKWSAGPALRLGHRSGPWVLGLLAGNLTSYAGDSGKADVNQLLVRGIVRYTFKEKWFFVYSPIITANWNASSDQRWLVPLGGGFGRHFFGGTPVDVSLQAYGNVIRPDGAPHSVVRLSFVLPFRVPSRP